MYAVQEPSTPVAPPSQAGCASGAPARDDDEDVIDLLYEWRHDK
jgi:hypothetical protein